MEKYQFSKIKNEILFEDFSRDFMKILYPDSIFQLYGKKGQSQFGIDGYSTSGNIYFQSKHKSKDTIKDKSIIDELNKEFSAAKPKIEELADNEKSKYLYITTHKQSTVIQDEAKNISTKEITVEYWGWEAIESSLNDLYKKENIDFFYKYYPGIAKNLEDNSIPKQLSIKSAANINGFIGREEEIKDIDKELTENKILLVNGIGGIGKSSIVNQYLFMKENEYSYFGIFEDISGFISDLNYSLNLKSETNYDLLKEAIIKLRKLSGNKLLIIDNISNIDENTEIIKTILTLKEYGFNIIFTSRETIEYIPSLELDIMNINDAKDLFNSIYKVEDELLVQILEYLDNHTFFIEKTAKTLKSKDTLTPELIKKHFENGKFSKIKMSRKKSFENFLNELFTVDSLDEEEVLVLKQISIFPSTFISFDDLRLVLQKKDPEEFEDLLNYLSDKGWLSKYFDSENNGYKLHQITKEYIFSVHSPKFEDLKIPINFYLLTLWDSSDLEVSLLHKNNIVYFESLYKALEILDIKNEEVFLLFNAIGNVYMHLGKIPTALKIFNFSLAIQQSLKDIKDNYLIAFYTTLGELNRRIGNKESLYYLKQACLLSEKALDKDDLNIASNYSNLGHAYKTFGQIDESFKSFNKALNLIKDKDNDIKLSYIYKGIAEVYQIKQKYKESLKYFEKTLSLRKKLLNNDSSLIAQSYNDLAFIFSEMGQIKKAISLYSEAIKRYEIILGEDHIDTASVYNNLGEQYRYNRQYEKAYSLIKKSMEIKEKELGKNSLQVALSYNTMGVYLMDIKDYTGSLNYLNKALNILNLTVGPHHEYTLTTKYNIEYTYSQMINMNSNITKISRNSPCPCGSGIKYKKCCG